LFEDDASQIGIWERNDPELAYPLEAFTIRMVGEINYFEFLSLLSRYRRKAVGFDLAFLY